MSKYYRGLISSIDDVKYKLQLATMTLKINENKNNISGIKNDISGITNFSDKINDNSSDISSNLSKITNIENNLIIVNDIYNETFDIPRFSVTYKDNRIFYKPIYSNFTTNGIIKINAKSNYVYDKNYTLQHIYRFYNNKRQFKRIILDHDRSSKTINDIFEIQGIDSTKIDIAIYYENNTDSKKIELIGHNTIQIKYIENNSKLDINKNNISDNLGKINDNSGLISTNTSDISDNTGLISTNTSSISDNSGLINDNSGLISTNTTSISDNLGKIDTNTSNISSNSGLINTNTSDISDNSGLINTNTSSISDNLGKINTNTSDISDNLGKIETNTSSISSNKGLIGTNTSEIASNLKKINDNKDDITALQNSNVKAFYNLDQIFIYDIEKGYQTVNKDNHYHIFEKEIVYDFTKNSYLEIILKVLTEVSNYVLIGYFQILFNFYDQDNNLFYTISLSTAMGSINKLSTIKSVFIVPINENMSKIKIDFFIAPKATQQNRSAKFTIQDINSNKIYIKYFQKTEEMSIKDIQDSLDKVKDISNNLEQINTNKSDIINLKNDIKLKNIYNV